MIDTPPQTVYLSGKDQEVVQVYFGNSPKGSLLIKKVSSADNSPISDVQFFVTESDGTVVGDGNGYFTTDSAGTILIDNIDPGTTLVAKEVKAKEGFLLDDTPQTAQIKAGQTTTLEFRNKPMGNLVIEKWGRNGSTEVPLEGVKFEIKYANGQYVDAAGGTLSSVVAAETWPGMAERVFTSIPFPRAMVAKVCRKSWKRICLHWACSRMRCSRVLM